jgi:hypothetical protein
MEKSVTEKTQIKKMRTKKELTIESKSESQIEKIEWLIDAIQATGLDEFMEYIRSPWKMFWPNLFAGIVRGFGAVIGATIVIAMIGWFLSTLIDIPLIGKSLEPYVETVQNEFNKFTEATNYRSNFERMESTLNSIDATLAEQNARAIRERESLLPQN